MYFCIKSSIGTQDKSWLAVKGLEHPHSPRFVVVYSTDCSKAVVPVLVLFSNPLRIAITSLG